MNNMRRGRLSAEGCRAEAQRCRRWAAAAASPNAAALLSELAREYGARATALERGPPLPSARFVMG